MAKIIDGKLISQQIREEIAQKVVDFNKKTGLFLLKKHKKGVFLKKKMNKKY